VFVQHVSSSGTVLLTTNGVEASGLTTMNHYYPKLALPTGSTDIYVYWNEMNGNQDQWGLYGQKISSSGALQWGNNGMTFVAVSTTNVYPIAARGNPTDMALVYEQYFDGINSPIKPMRIATTCTFLWTPTSITMCSVNSQKVHPVVNNFQNNQWIAAWEDNRSGNSDIFAQNIQLGGTMGPPVMGTISGQITLNGGSGNVTQVSVQAGSTTTNPDATGHYTMQVYPGTYTVSASLTGYNPASQSGVVVVSNQTTTVNLTLNAIQIGTIDGHVTLVGGTGFVNAVVVTAGTNTASPDATGHYAMLVSPGTYTVIGTLYGYIPDTVHNVVVVNNQTTLNVNLTLNVAPTNGTITGTVVLNGGSGNVIAVTVDAGGYTTHPLANGTYSLTVPAGMYDVSASLTGYITQTNLGVQVVVNQTTPNVNFTLVPETSAGHIEGTVTLTGGTADVTLTTVSSGSYSTHPNAAGFYSLQIPQGSYNVTASNPYTTSQTNNNIQVLAGQTTPNVNFLLTVNRADLVCLAYLQGTLTNGVNVNITGPEGPYSGTITNDSLVFPHVPYGNYIGQATYGMAWADTVADINAANHEMIFQMVFGGINDHHDLVQFQVIPNPTGIDGNIRLNLTKSNKITIFLSDQQGRFIKFVENRLTAHGPQVLPLRELLTGIDISEGIYFITLYLEGKALTTKMIYRK
ncbi:MAG: carboxypeptidase-like regulatory domain-containing protein, partial [Bacteroidota bacterium]